MRACSALPLGCGRWAIARTCSIARQAENAVAGALAGTGAGRRLDSQMSAATRRKSANAVRNALGGVSIRPLPVRYRHMDRATAAEKAHQGAATADCAGDAAL